MPHYSGTTDLCLWRNNLNRSLQFTMAAVKSKHAVTASGPQHGTNRMCTPTIQSLMNKAGRIWVAEGTKPIRAEELRGSAEQPLILHRDGIWSENPSTLSGWGKHKEPKTQQEVQKRFTEIQSWKIKNKLLLLWTWHKKAGIASFIRREAVNKITRRTRSMIH